MKGAAAYKAGRYKEFVRDMLRAQGLGGKPFNKNIISRHSRRLARNPNYYPDYWGLGTNDSLWKTTGLGHSPFEGWSGYTPLHPAWG